MTTHSKATATPAGATDITEHWMSGWPRLFEANRRAMDDWMKLNAILANSLFELSQEMLRFAQNRFQEDVETNVALASCRSPSDSFEYQRRFLERATTQYHETADKLTELMSRMTSEMLSATRHPSAEGERAIQVKKGPVQRSGRREQY